MMKVCICTTPIRPVPTDFPPFGSMAIIQSLEKIGVNADFFNIDFFRPDLDQIERYFGVNKFDVVGISAVVSTAYAFTKKLGAIIRAISPQTIIVVGGNLAASAELLLRRGNADLCVIGDGELISQQLFSYLSSDRNWKNDLHLSRIKGLAFLDCNDKFIFTGYGSRPSSGEISFPDYSILVRDGSISHFIPDSPSDVHEGVSENRDEYIKKSILVGTKQAHVTMAKGCVARCTFCHRWEKGYRARPVSDIIAHIQMLIKTYGVGKIIVTDENFGADRKLTRDLAIELGKLGVAWVVAGVRARTVNRDDLELWARNGCVTAYFGIESGSSKILEIMEKQATVEENLNALRWTSEVGIATTIQLVVGMPGEDDQTINETIDFLKQASEFLIDWKNRSPSELISINYAQALPGTPLYEFAREFGYIQQGIDAEEQYLLKISDTDAYTEDHFINYTGLPMLKVLTWRPRVLAEIDAHHFKRTTGVNSLTIWYLLSYYYSIVKYRVLRRISSNSDNGRDVWSSIPKSGYFNIHTNLKFAPLLLNPITKFFFYPMLLLAVAFWRGGTIFNSMKLLYQHATWSLGIHKIKRNEIEAYSLRKIIKISKITDAEDGMIQLRQGR